MTIIIAFLVTDTILGAIFHNAYQQMCLPPTKHASFWCPWSGVYMAYKCFN